MNKYTKKSLTSIGLYIKSDHSTILHYKKKHKDLYEISNEYRYDFNYV